MSNRWLTGPQRLREKKSWPDDIVTKPSLEREAESKILKNVLGVAAKEDDSVITQLEKFSRRKVIRVCALIRRFLTNARFNQNQRNFGRLKFDELDKV